MLVEMWNPKMLIKLVTTTEIQELELNTDANNKALVKRWFCNALFWW